NKAHMVLNASYLLDDQRADDFAAAVAALAEQHPGVRLELTGPWPPYSFAGPEEGGRQGAYCLPTSRYGRPRWPGNASRRTAQRCARSESPWWICSTGY